MSQILSLSLDNQIYQAIKLIFPTYCLVLIDNETFSSIKESKLWLQNYTFTQRFALVSTLF